MANKKKFIYVAICAILSLIALFVPASVYGIQGLTVIEQRVIAIFILAALLWILEPIPIWTTSVFIMVTMLLTVSTSSFKPLITPDETYWETKNVNVSKLDKQVVFDSPNKSAVAYLVANKDFLSLSANVAQVKSIVAKNDSAKKVALKSAIDINILSSIAIKSSDSTAVTFSPVTVNEMKFQSEGLTKKGKKPEAGETVNCDFKVLKYDSTFVANVLGAADVVNAPAEENVAELNQLGTPIKYKDIMAAFADPTIMLFMGGFVLAIAAGKIGMDGHLAKVLLSPFGTNPKFVMLGFLLVTGIFSMFMSNTATAAMMLAIMAPVINAMRDENGNIDKGCVGLAMAIPIGANIGGMGTPIGTPPNGVAIKYINDPEYLGLHVGFGDWMMVMLPVVIIIFIFAWFLLTKMYPFAQKKIELKINNEAFQNADKKDRLIICVTFAVTVLLWVTDKLTGVNSYIVALVPFAVLAVTGIFTKKDLAAIDWDVLWLVAGGFALGVGLEKTGLAAHMCASIPFGEWSPMVVILGSGILCLMMSTFMSNSASAALLIPIMYTVGKGMDLGPFGGVCTLVLGVALSASLAMALPISTPPNALAYSTGLVKSSDMAKVGLIVGIFGYALAFAVLLLIVGPNQVFG